MLYINRDICENVCVYVNCMPLTDHLSFHCDQNTDINLLVTFIHTLKYISQIYYMFFVFKILLVVAAVCFMMSYFLGYRDKLLFLCYVLLSKFDVRVESNLLLPDT